MQRREATVGSVPNAADLPASVAARFTATAADHSLPLLEVANLSKQYGDVQALTDATFDVPVGQLVAVIGPSGSGKTTLIRCINRLVEPTSGSIRYASQDLLSLRGTELRKARARIGMIFQHYNLVTRLSVIENVLHGRLGHKGTLQGVLGIYSDEEKEKAVEVLTLLGLEQQIYRRCDQLSGGQKQRVGIARALVQDPGMILCDEPISSLDPSSSKVIMDNLQRIQVEFGITIFVNLHQVDVAKRYADRILGFNHGRLVFDGPPADLTTETIQSIYGTEAGELLIA